MAIAFPKQCLDFDYDVICGCDNDNLDAEIHAIIPRINHIETYDKYENDLTAFDDESDNEKRISADKNLTYDVLDLIEFIYYYLRDFFESVR